MIIPVILSGGAGVRLWPLSSAAVPKQFLAFGSDHTLIQDTVLRCVGDHFDPTPIIISGESHRFLVAENMRAINLRAEIILEPLRRDSCAAVAAGCLIALQRSPDAVVLVLAADHRISEPERFRKAVGAALEDAKAGYLTTFGIEPDLPAIGFGYIKKGALLREGGSFQVDKFVEKPNLETAKRYLTEGYLWNSGNFLFQAARFIEELKKHAPAILYSVEASVAHAECEGDFIRLQAAAFSESPSVSVDYAVMEKTERAAVYPVNYGWNDIGSWDAVYDALSKDKNGNVVEGRGYVFDGRNNLVHSHETLTVISDIDDAIVITTPDVVLVMRRGEGEKTKSLVANLKANKLIQ